MNAKEIAIADYLYDLPNEQIAQYPLAERDASKLLVYRDLALKEDTYANLAEYLPEGSILYFNDTKVLQARMFFQNSKGQKIEIFCLEPADNRDIALNMASVGQVNWTCLVGGAAKWKEKTLTFEHDQITLTAEIIARKEDVFIINFAWQPADKSFAEVLHLSGVMPIPPYLKRNTEQIDLQRYQTIYAREEGSVAAPTAGLHFTEQLMERLVAKNVKTDYVTLHVGAGTFKPVKAPVLAEHDMHAEFLDVSLETIVGLLAALDSTVVAVGTTSLRTLESLYWLGAKCHLDPNLDLTNIAINQWDAYELAADGLDTKTALLALVACMKAANQTRLICKTSLLIVPGYTFKVIDALVTNFHQPGSTLILLVAAVTNGEWRELYEVALQRNFRFLSYGDGSLLFCDKE